MTTCPVCDTIRVVCIDATPFEKGWHVHCQCGWAWNHSSFFRSKSEAKECWERFMKLRMDYKLREPIK